MAHPQTNFSSNFQGVDPPLEGYWHDDPIPCGGGNVVTDIWPNSAGVPVVVKGFNALTDEDIADKLDNTGNASNTTSTFTKASGDTSSMTSGGKLSVIFTAISGFFASLKALAFKDKASYNDLSSGVQSSLDKADSALQSHQSVTDNNPTLAWGATSKVGTVGSTDLRVTMPANPASYKVPFINIDSSLASLDLNTLTTQGFYYCAGFQSSSVVLSNIPSELDNFTKSWRLEVINQRSRIEQILVNASDNGEDATRVMGIWKRHRFSAGTWTPWVNMRDASWISSGTFDAARIPTSLPNVTAGAASQLSHVTSQNEASTWRQIAKLDSSDTNRVLAQGFVVAVRERINDTNFYTGTYIVSCTSKGSDCKILQGIRRANGYEMEFVVAVDSNSITLYAKSSSYSPYHVTALFGNPIIAIGSAIGSKPAGTDVAKTFLLDTSGQVGSPSIPVYVDPDGQVQPCTQGATLKTNTATLYIAGTFGDGNLPYYHVKDIKNGCVNYVHVKDIPSNTCSITIEAPALTSGEEYDYAVVFDTFTNSNLVGSIDVENCKNGGRFENNVFVVDSMALTSGNPRYVPMIVVTGNVASSKWYERL